MRLTRAVMVGFASMTSSVGGAVTAVAADPPSYAISTADGDGPTYRAPAALISDPSSSTVDYTISLPSGASLSSDPQGGVDVVSPDGSVEGSFVPAFAYDQSGISLQSSFQVDGNIIRESVEVPATTSYPVVVDPTYVRTGNIEDAQAATEFRQMLSSPATSSGLSSTSSQVHALATVAATSSGANPVRVPSRYVYNTHLSPTTLHDYCTTSPDEYRNLLGVANFRGPCAYHDLCLMDAGPHGNRTPCDDALPGRMKTNCASVFGSWSPFRYDCYADAAVYWTAVTINTSFFH